MSVQDSHKHNETVSRDWMERIAHAHSTWHSETPAQHEPPEYGTNVAHACQSVSTAHVFAPLAIDGLDQMVLYRSGVATKRTSEKCVLFY